MNKMLQYDRYAPRLCLVSGLDVGNGSDGHSG
jgi:hypothetical protein